MCTFAAGASLALQTASDYLGQRAMAKSAQATMNAQSKAAITEMNYKLSNFEQERTDAFDKAVAEISNLRLNSLQLNSGVKAAVAETMSGRTANLITRTAEGDTARTVASIQDNYDRKSNEVDLNWERTVMSTHSYLENLNASAPKMPSRLTNFVNFGVNALGAYTQGMNEKNAKGIANSKPTTNASNAANSSLYNAWGAYNIQTGNFANDMNWSKDFVNSKKAYQWKPKGVYF